MTKAFVSSVHTTKLSDGTSISKAAPANKFAELGLVVEDATLVLDDICAAEDGRHLWR
jgi:hypothetical protein